MTTAMETASPSKVNLWAGRIMTGLSILFMLMDAGMHLLMPPPAVDAFKQLGFPLNLGPVLGVIALLSVVVYAIPRTAVLGAILLTGYFGGAVAENMRVQHPVFETVFPVLFGLLVWGGVYFRDERLRALIPVRM